jgi:PIN domain nuclease of toxin-antitoxin system
VTEIVLDASAVLAVIHEETGSEKVEPHLGGACISAVNVSEVVTKLQERGLTDAEIEEVLMTLDLDVRPHDTPLAVAAGLLRNATRAAGLSLGDRACLALGTALQARILTADQAWRNLDCAMGIEFIR